MEKKEDLLGRLGYQIYKDVKKSLEIIKWKGIIKYIEDKIIIKEKKTRGGNNVDEIFCIQFYVIWI